MMPRYIDLDEIRKLLDACPNKGYVEMDEIPPADVVEVVRCKDCRYAHQYKFRKTESWIIECNNNEGLYRDVPEDGYCYCGERREE